MQRWTPIAGCVGQTEGTHVTWSDHLAEIDQLKHELNATQSRLEKSDDLLREEFAQKSDAIASIKDIRIALRGMLSLDEEYHQRGCDDDDVSAEVRTARSALFNCPEWIR